MTRVDVVAADVIVTSSSIWIAVRKYIFSDHRSVRVSFASL